MKAHGVPPRVFRRPPEQVGDGDSRIEDHGTAYGVAEVDDPGDEGVAVRIDDDVVRAVVAVDHLGLELAQSRDDGVVEQPERLSGQLTVLFLRRVVDELGQLVEVLEVPHQSSLGRRVSEGLERPVDSPEHLAHLGELFRILRSYGPGPHRR